MKTRFNQQQGWFQWELLPIGIFRWRGGVLLEKSLYQFTFSNIWIFFLVRSDRRGKKGLHLLYQARTTQKLSFASVVIRKFSGGLGQMLYSRYIGVLIFMHPECHSFGEITTDSGWNYNHLLVLLIHLTKLSTGNPLSKVSLRGKSTWWSRLSLIHSWIFLVCYLMARSWFLSALCHHHNNATSIPAVTQHVHDTNILSL